MEQQPIELYEMFRGFAQDESRMTAEYAEERFKQAGIPTALIESGPGRKSLYAKIKSPTPALTPLLLYACSGTAYAAALYTLTMLEIRRRRERLVYDVVLLLADCEEDDDSPWGLRYFTEKQRKLFKGIRYALGRRGGYPVAAGNKRLYPIMTAECFDAGLRVVAREPRSNDGWADTSRAMAIPRAAKAITLLHTKPMPVRVTEPVRQMSAALGKALGETDEFLHRQMLKPGLTKTALFAMGRYGRLFAPLMRCETRFTAMGSALGGDVPELAFFEAGMRLLPGMSAQDAEADIRSVIGAGYEIEASLDRGDAERRADMTLFNGLTEALLSYDERALAIPCVSRTPTEARFLARLGIQVYGFAPVNPPDDGVFTELGKAVEDMPVAGSLEAGVNVMMEFLSSRGRE